MKFPILNHLQVLDKALSVLSKEALLAFSAACCERQIVELKRAVENFNPQLGNNAGQILDQVWQCLVCERNLGDEANPLLEELFEADIDADYTGVAIDIIGAFEHLASRGKSDPRSRAYTVAEIALNQTEALLYNVLDVDINDEGRAIVRAHQLIRQEMQRQLNDAETLRVDPSPSTFRGLRIKYDGRGLFDTLWYLR